MLLEVRHCLSVLLAPGPEGDIQWLLELSSQKTAGGWELEYHFDASSCASTPFPHPHCLMRASDSAQDCGWWPAS